MAKFDKQSISQKYSLFMRMLIISVLYVPAGCVCVGGGVLGVGGGYSNIRSVREWPRESHPTPFLGLGRP